MDIVIEPNYDKNRHELSQIVPIRTPYTILIEVTRVCNFSCYYCMHSTKNDPNGEYEKIKLRWDEMPLALFHKISKEISQMKPQPKRVLLLGLGEPLMNTEILNMIKTLRKDGFTGRIDLITNGSMINEKMADLLIGSGLSKILISLQGINSEAYKKNCGYNINFEEFVNNLTYLYKNKGKMQIYIKVIDCMLDTKEEKEYFYNVFGKISDTCNIEHLIVNQLQMGDHNGKVNHRRNIHNEKILNRDICPMPFYQIQIFLDGTVLPCPISGISKDLAIGDANTQSLMDIWNGNRRKIFLETMLTKKRSIYEPCRNCESIHCISVEEENLDNNSEKILERMEKYYGVRD